MDISKKEQTQTAGDNAIQYQIESQNNNYSTQVTQYFGASPSEMVSVATTVYNQMYALSAKNYAEIATTTVNDRINAFGCELFPRLEKVEGALEKFMDPKFEFLLGDAQVTAAKSDRHDDLCMLSELLACHVLKGEDKKIDAGISHAIKIVDEIDNDALCALTIVCAFQFYSPVSGIAKEGLDILNNMFGKLMYLELPTGMNWMDHLDMLGALRMLSFGLKKSEPLLVSKFQEYSCAGIKKDSDELKRAYEILAMNNISRSVIIDNECLDGYVRLNISDIDRVKSQYKESILQIRSLYTKDKTIITAASSNFINMWNSYENLKQIRDWWDTIPYAFNVSYMGRVLAQTNAKRIDHTLPDLI